MPPSELVLTRVSTRVPAKVPMFAALSASSLNCADSFTKTSPAMLSTEESLAPAAARTFSVISLTIVATVTPALCICRPTAAISALLPAAAKTGSKLSRSTWLLSAPSPRAFKTFSFACAALKVLVVKSAIIVVKGVTTVDPAGALRTPLKDRFVSISVPPNATIFPATPPGSE